MLTPANIEKNWIFSHLEFRERLNRRGSQCTSPAIMANTAPIDRT